MVSGERFFGNMCTQTEFHLVPLYLGEDRHLYGTHSHQNNLDGKTWFLILGLTVPLSYLATNIKAEKAIISKYQLFHV